MPHSVRRWPTCGKSWGAAGTSSTSTRVDMETCEAVEEEDDDEEGGWCGRRGGKLAKGTRQPNNSSTLIEVARGVAGVDLQ